jgi:uncharacterized protein (TIGR02246 family)
MEEPPELAQLRDEAAITRLIHRFSACLDAKDWTGYAETFTPDGVFEIFGQQRVGRTAIADGPSQGLARYDRTHHYNTNITIDVNGDEATARSSLLAIHVPDLSDPTVHADAGAVYDYRCVRTPDGWAFAHVRVHVTWSAGLSLFA